MTTMVIQDQSPDSKYSEGSSLSLTQLDNSLLDNLEYSQASVWSSHHTPNVSTKRQMSHHWLSGCRS
ncbi:hypothetical protein Q8A67_010320 [Cirrhinus molitorella]|uniref:Uncharacterized protein n=1 Tax=Cirrhinus molitorella TaxID=172907 RepID=A0AA88Q189_9TELE|nr:hypothetical protein Q8A67_010320 [Cirrhinus molitorella]